MVCISKFWECITCCALLNRSSKFSQHNRILNSFNIMWRHCQLGQSQGMPQWLQNTVVTSKPPKSIQGWKNVMMQHSACNVYLVNFNPFWNDATQVIWCYHRLSFIIFDVTQFDSWFKFQLTIIYTVSVCSLTRYTHVFL